MDLFDQKKESKSLTSLIFEKVREKIVNGYYKGGDKIVEAKVADEMGVSRTPVREALKQLELDGLVENIPNRGVVVKGFTQKDIEDIYTMRIAIEAVAAKWSVERMNDDDLQQLKDIFELMEFYTFKKDVEKVFELNTKFHETIYKAACSRYLEHVLSDFQEFIKGTRLKSLSTAGRLEATLEEHRQILEAYAKKDVELAVEKLVAHIENSKKNANF